METGLSTQSDASRRPPVGRAPVNGAWWATMDYGRERRLRHYIMQTTARGDKLERCRMEANEALPFACPDGCVFYEPRKVSSAGWHVAPRGPTSRLRR